MPDPQLAMGDQRKGSGNVYRAKSMPLSLLEREIENGDSCSRSPSPSTERCPSILPSETVQGKALSGRPLPTPSFSLRPGSGCIPPQPSSLWSRGKPGIYTLAAAYHSKGNGGKAGFPVCWLLGTHQSYGCGLPLLQSSVS